MADTEWIRFIRYYTIVQYFHMNVYSFLYFTSIGKYKDTLTLFVMVLYLGNVKMYLYFSSVVLMEIVQVVGFLPGRSALYLALLILGLVVLATQEARGLTQYKEAAQPVQGLPFCWLK